MRDALERWGLVYISYSRAIARHNHEESLHV